MDNNFFEEWPGWPLTKDVISNNNLQQYVISNNNLQQYCDSLKLGFHSLPSFVEKQCLRYVALFPKDYFVSESDLIDYWIGEGFLSHGGSNMREAVKRGEYIIQLLISMNLLEEVIDWRVTIVKAVKMPHALRDLFLQGKFGEFDEILVTEDDKISHKAMREKASPFHALKFEDFGGILTRLGFKSESDTFMVKKWRHAKFVNDRFVISDKKLQRMPSCPNLQTLILSYNYQLSSLATGISNIFPYLKVLDLSHTSIKVLPPSIGNMKYLQYLDLSSTRIESLPSELGRLNKLKCFKLSRTYLKHFPENIILKLVELQLFEMVAACPVLGSHNFDKFEEEMKYLKKLDILKISVYFFDDADRLMKIKTLASSVTYLHISYIELPSLEFQSVFQRMPNLEYLEISWSRCLGEITLHGRLDQIFPATLKTLCILNCSNLQTFDVQRDCLPFLQNLRQLQIMRCPMLRSICWVKYLPNLIELMIEQNDMIEYLFDEKLEGEHHSFFPKLRFLTLDKLSLLRCIGDLSSLVSLEYLNVFKCPRLRTLSYSGSVILPNIKEINGEIGWWNNIQLDKTAKAYLSQSFRK